MGGTETVHEHERLSHDMNAGSKRAYCSDTQEELKCS